LFTVIAHLPVEDHEVYFIGLTDIDALVESLRVEKVTAQVEVHHRVDSLHAAVLQLESILVLLGLLVYLSELADVLVLLGQLTLAAYDRVVDFWGQLIPLLVEGHLVGRFDNLSDEWIQGLAEVVASLLWHLRWQMIHTMEKDAVFGSVVDFVNEVVLRYVEANERFLDGREFSGELNRAIIVCRNVTDTHEPGLAPLMVGLQVLGGEDPWILCLPVYTVNQKVDIWEVLLELACIKVRVSVIVLLVERTNHLLLANEVLCLKM
jgi:hypothetical protein